MTEVSGHDITLVPNLFSSVPCWWAECSCGWEGPRRQGAASIDAYHGLGYLAEADADEHLKEMNQSPPKAPRIDRPDLLVDLEDGRTP